MSREAERTPTEEAREAVEEWLEIQQQCEEDREHGGFTPADFDALVARLTPVFERAQAFDGAMGAVNAAGYGPETIEGCVNDLRDRAERAERAESAEERLELELVAHAAALEQARAESDEARRERDIAQSLATTNLDKCDSLRDDLARLRVREGQLREVLERSAVALHLLRRSIRDERHGEWGMCTVPICVEARALLSSPSDAPDVLGAVRRLAMYAESDNLPMPHNALATLRAAGVIE